VNLSYFRKNILDSEETAPSYSAAWTETAPEYSAAWTETAPSLHADYGSDGSDMVCSSTDESSTMSDDEEMSDDDEQMQSPPLYVLPPSESVYEGPITKMEHMLATCAFTTRFNLCDTGFKQLLELIRLHVPINNICESDIANVKEMCGFGDSYLTFHLYCCNCKKLFLGREQCETPGCRALVEKQNYFVTGNMEIQLKQVLERPGMWSSLNVSRECGVDSADKSLSDITSGSGYTKLRSPGGFLHRNANITLTMFTDGVPLFKSSHVSIWPVYLTINEIPPRERFLKKNMILWGVWQGAGKPKMNMFLRPLVTDLLQLYTDGVTIKTDIQSEVVKVMLLTATMDLPARAEVLHMTHHNGQYGCLYCLEPGHRVPSGDGNCQSYTYHAEPVLRSHESVQFLARKSRDTGKRETGFTGESVLLYLPYFQPTRDVVIDYIHGILLGIAKKLMTRWFDGKSYQEPYFIGHQTAAIDTMLKNIQPPYLIHRLPRKVSKYSHWKASEIRSWLLFYSVPCLLDILPPVFITHLASLVEAVHIMLGEGISAMDLQRADVLIHSFCSNCATLYGENIMGLNVHNLPHLVECVRQWGPLWAWSCFAFESFNGNILKSVHGTGNVCRQIFWMLQAQKRVEQMTYQMPAGSLRKFFRNMCEGSGSSLPSGVDAYQCSVIRPMVDFKEGVSEDLQQKLTTILGSEFVPDACFCCFKIVRNGFVMYSKKCSRVKRRNSYTIALHSPLGNGCEIVQVEYFLVHKVSERVYAVARALKVHQFALPRRLPQVKEYVYSSTNFDVVRAENLREPVVFMQVGNKMYASLFPNHMERD
jgi:hypothetical protein